MASGIHIDTFVQGYAAGLAGLIRWEHGRKASVSSENASLRDDPSARARLQEWAERSSFERREQNVVLDDRQWLLLYHEQPGKNGHRYAICIEQPAQKHKVAIEQKEEEDEEDEEDDGRTPRQELQKRLQREPQEKDQEEEQARNEWFDRWSALKVPGLDPKDAQAHLEHFRRVKWENTCLGPISEWDGSLLSAVSQCLASPFPVLLAWGSDLVMIYNLAYGLNIAEKHPRILGMSYKAAWPEVWDMLEPVTRSTLAGKTTHVDNAQMYLMRDGYLEETFFSWSMIPVLNEAKEMVGIYIPNFETTSVVIAERRLRLLRQASQSVHFDMTPPDLFRQVCQTISENDIDLPLAAFYDCSASEDTEEISSTSLDALSTTDPGDRDRDHGVPGLDKDDEAALEQAGEVKESLSDPAVQGSISQEELQRHHLGVTFVRTACHGAREDSKIFPSDIPPQDSDSDSSISSHPSFLKHFRQLQKDHKPILLQREDLKEFQEELDAAATGDSIQCLYLMPITTIDDNLRAIAILGLNPKKRHDDDYQVFLDLFQAQLSHGVTSIRLVNEELRRSRFIAAIVKRKNDELGDLLDARTSELRHSELKFLKMAEINPAGIWRANIDREVTFVNEAWWDLTAHPRGTDPSLWVESIHEDDIPIAQRAWEECLTTRKSIKPVELRWKGRDGQPPRWSWITTSPEFDQDGVLTGVTGSLTDITAKKEFEALQQQRMEDAIESRRAQERFIDMTSHEMRNPLSAICLSADASAERLEAITNNMLIPCRTTADLKTDLEDTLSDLKIINHCCTHMTRLIDDVLTLSKLDNQFLVVTPVPSRPVDFLTETISVFKAEMVAKDIDYQFRITPAFAELNVDYVLTDPSRINQLVINLVTNAIKFTAQCAIRSITITLDCSASRPDLPGISSHSPPVATDLISTAVPLPSPTASESDDIYLVVSIADSGRGLTQDEISGLFQRFKQANPKTHISYGGSGLGLFICRRIVALLDGEIGVTSERGKGSTFQFYVQSKRWAGPEGSSDDASPHSKNGYRTASDTEVRPTTSPKVKVEHTPAPSPERTRLSCENDKIAVLIVEDNLVNQKLLEKHLARMGCLTTCANNGREAVNLIKQSRWACPNGRRVDCVLMDIEMPVLDGIEAIKEIRELQTDGQIAGHVPVLAVSANARQEQIDSMLSSGFDGTVSKPFKVPAILEKMRSLLRHLQGRSQQPL